MARRPTRKQPINTDLPKGRRSTQRERLLGGMIAAANRGGYAGASVSAVIEQAGVSRPTFYEYFEDRHDCFLAALVDVHTQLLADVREALDGDPPEQAGAAAVQAIVSFSGSQPARARFLMNEALAGGPGALQLRDQGVVEIAQAIEDAFAQVATRQPIPDVPVTVIVGAIYRLLASRMRRGERDVAGISEGLVAWLDSYARPAGKQRWRKLAAGKPPPPSPYLSKSELRAPPRLPPGRPSISEEAVAEIHRQRIMFATAQAVQERGYAATTVAQIARLAGVDVRIFYRLFTDKQEAFSAIHELGFQYLMAATAGAFFAARTWPERVWEAMRVATQSVESNPAIAHTGFVEAYAVGPAAIQRVEDSRAAFTIFLQEGRQYRPAQSPPSRTALEATVAALFEAIYRQARDSQTPKAGRLTALLTYLCLAPVIGPDEATRFVEEAGGRH